MRYLKQFEGFDETEEEINYILLDIKEDFPELEFSMLKTSPFLWRFASNTILGYSTSRKYYKKMSNYISEIVDRLSDIGINAESNLRKIDSSGFGGEFQISINLKF